MMIKRENAKSYLLYKDKCFYIRKNDKNLYLDESIFYQIELLEELNDIYSYKKDLILIRDDKNRSVVLNIEKKREKFLFDDIDIRVSDLFAKYLLFYKKDPYMQGVFNYFTNEVAAVSEGSPIGDVVIDNFIIRKLSDRLSVVDLQVFNSWQFPISDFPDYGIPPHRQKAEIKQIIGIYNNLLWVHIGGFHLIGIDIENGKLVHHIEDLPSYLGLDADERTYFHFAPLNDGIHLDKDKGLIKAFATRYYIEIDLNNLMGIIKKDFGNDYKTGWRIQISNFYQEEPNKLFFSGSFGDSWPNPNMFGIFDTDSAEIIWSKSNEEKGLFFKSPQANNSLLAILDDKNNLLIYDRKEINI